MVHACCAFRCSNRHPKQGVSFYRLPADRRRRAQWIAAIKRDNWKPSENSRLCSEHFVGGKKCDNPLSPAYVPSIFMSVFSPGKKQKEDMETIDISPQAKTSFQFTESIKREASEDFGSPNFAPSVFPCSTQAETDDGAKLDRISAKLELEGSALQDPQDDGGAAQFTDKTSEANASQSQDDTRIRNLLLERSRCDTSLGILTQRVKEMMSLSANGVLDLNEVSRELGVSKRRIYDVTNVLEGIKLVKKKSKNHIQWMGGETKDTINGELGDLMEEESKLDELIQTCARQINQLCEDRHYQRFAYLTYKDVNSILSLREQTVIVIKAPAETKLEVPHPAESFQVHLSSIRGPIDVYFCSDKPIPTGSVKSSTKRSQVIPTTRGKDFLLPLPVLSVIQVSSKEDASNSRGISKSSNGQSESTPRLPLVSVTATPAIPQLALSVVGGEYLLRLANNQGITNLFPASLDPSAMDVPLT